MYKSLPCSWGEGQGSWSLNCDEPDKIVISKHTYMIQSDGEIMCKISQMKFPRKFSLRLPQAQGPQLQQPHLHESICSYSSGPWV